MLAVRAVLNDAQRWEYLLLFIVVFCLAVTIASQMEQLFMNLTISIDDQTLERARALARKRGISLQDLLRQYLESLVGTRTADDTADELIALFRNAGGRSGGARIERSDAYQGRA